MGVVRLAARGIDFVIELELYIHLEFAIRIGMQKIEEREKEMFSHRESNPSHGSESAES